MLEQAEEAEEEEEHSSICAKAASVPCKLKKLDEPGEQLLVHIEWLGLSPVGYPAVVMRNGFSPGSAAGGEEEPEEGEPPLGSSNASQPALPSASRSRVTSAKSRFIAAVLYDSWATKLSKTRTDFQGTTGLIVEDPSGAFAPVLAG